MFRFITVALCLSFLPIFSDNKLFEKENKIVEQMQIIDMQLDGLEIYRDTGDRYFFLLGKYEGFWESLVIMSE